MKKNKVLLIGYSNISRKRFINVFKKLKIKYEIASLSKKYTIEGNKIDYNNYLDALRKSKATIAYISLPNSLHYYWAKKALNFNYHVIVDKPVSHNFSRTESLLKLSIKKNKLLSEAIFFNYHEQFKKALNLTKDIFKVKANFIIPYPKKNSLLLSRKFNGGVLMDMGPYIASLHRLLINDNLIIKDNLIKKTLSIKKNSKNLPISIKFNLDFKNIKYEGLFEFGNNYVNNLKIFTKKKIIELNRIFSPPSDENLFVRISYKNNLKILKINKDDCFENYFKEILKNIKLNNFTFYVSSILADNRFKKFLFNQ